MAFPDMISKGPLEEETLTALNKIRPYMLNSETGPGAYYPKVVYFYFSFRVALRVVLASAQASMGHLRRDSCLPETGIHPKREGGNSRICSGSHGC